MRSWIVYCISCMYSFKVPASGLVPKGRFDSHLWSEGAISTTFWTDQLAQIQAQQSRIRAASIQSISVPGTVLPVQSHALWKSTMVQFESMYLNRCSDLRLQNDIAEYSACSLLYSSRRKSRRKCFRSFKGGLLCILLLTGTICWRI